MQRPETTIDAVLGGRLRLGQPSRGHRAGTDAVLVAAAVPAMSGDSIVDFGAGVGTVGLAVLVRVSGTRALLVEIDPKIAAMAEDNVVANDLAERARVLALDVAIAGMGATSALAGSADHIVSNPPFNAAAGRASPDAATARARIAGEGQFEDWTRAAVRVLKPAGSLTVIHRPEALAEILAALRPRFGGVVLRFVHPEAGTSAVRVLVQAWAGSRGPLRVLPPLILNGVDGRFTPEAEALHRNLAPLDMS